MIRLALGQDLAVNIEPRVPPGEKAFRPFGAEEFPADKKRQDLAGKELSQPGVVDPGDLMEEAGLVHSTLGHQEMEMGVKIYPVSKGLNGGDNPGHQLAPGCHLEITSQ
jgi:hypothetical protein